MAPSTTNPTKPARRNRTRGKSAAQLAKAAAEAAAKLAAPAAEEAPVAEAAPEAEAPKRRGRPPVWQTVEVDGEKVKVRASLTPEQAISTARTLLLARKPQADTEPAPAKPARAPRAASPRSGDRAKPQGGAIGVRLLGVEADGTMRDLGIHPVRGIAAAKDAYEASNPVHFPGYLGVMQRNVWTIDA